MIVYTKNKMRKFKFEDVAVYPGGLIEKINPELKSFTLAYKYDIVIENSKVKKKGLDNLVFPRTVEKSILSHYKYYIKDRNIVLLGDMITSVEKKKFDEESICLLNVGKYSLYHCEIRLTFNGAVKY